MSNEASRKAFEAWAEECGLDISTWTKNPNAYKYDGAIASWASWQASRKALEAEQAQASKQPLSTENAGLIQWVREFADMEFSQHSTESKKLRKAADMLEADAQWQSLYEQREEEAHTLSEQIIKLRAQQVAVPAAALTVLKEMVGMMESGDEHGEGSEWYLKALAAIASSCVAQVAVPAQTMEPVNISWKNLALWYEAGANDWDTLKRVVTKMTPNPTQQVAVPAGYVLVPKTPTNEMTSAMADALEDPENERSSWDLAENMYQAMLAAAPQPPQGDKQ